MKKLFCLSVVSILIFSGCNKEKLKSDDNKEGIFMSYFSIPASESALPFALDQYYSELNRIIGERAGQPLLLNNTITTFDIDKDAPFYSEGVFRLFADRKFSHSPVDLGTAIQADRFSQRYEDVVEIVAARIDATLPSEANQEIKNYVAEIRRVRKDLRDYEIDVNNDWQEITRAENLTPDSPNYNLRRLNFYENIFYADVKEEFNAEIQRYRFFINQIRSEAYSPSQLKLIRSYGQLAETYKVARPWSSRFEKTTPDVNYLTFADPKVRSRQICDVSPPSFPAGIDLVKFQQGADNIRNIRVDENTVHNELHTRTWSGGASGSYSAFGIRLGGGGGSSGASSYKKDFQSLKSFEMGFSDISEIYVNRGMWYDPSLFKDTELKKIIDEIPGARDLKYVSVSLIIARGLTLKVNFDEELEEERWSRRHFRARGGVRVFGFKFGGGGSSTRYDYDFQLSENKKTVTFTDDSEHCRLVAVRLEKIYHPSDEEDESITLQTEFNQEELEKLMKGEISYELFQTNQIYGEESKN